jgi:hypothetical protein
MLEGRGAFCRVPLEAFVRCFGGCTATHLKGTSEVARLNEVFVVLGLIPFS